MTKGSFNNGGAVMATTTKTAEAGNAGGADMEAVKAQAIADYKARIASIEGVFAGMDVSAEDKNKFIDDDSKTVADATAFALERQRKRLPLRPKI
jgi:hypothetical protein